MLAQEQADELRLAVARRFGFSGRSVWWWEEVEAGKSIIVEYGSGQDGLRILLTILRGAQQCLLFITDDDSPPWPCVRATAAYLADMLREQWFFEYLVVDEEFTTCVFDTHHNVIIALGDMCTDQSAVGSRAESECLARPCVERLFWSAPDGYR